LPFSEEAVRSVIAKLEPPRHFAATYGNGGDSIESASPTPSPPSRFARPPRVPWPVIAAASCAFLPVGCFLALFAAANHEDGAAVVFVFLTLISFGLTPFAIWRAFKQLLLAPEKASGRSLVLNSTVAYAVVAPALLMLMLTIATFGFALVPLGAAAFIYLQYVLVRRLSQRMSDALPPQPSVNGSPNGHGRTAPLSTASPAPAM